MRPAAAAIRESLEHRILHGLVCEWENALGVLPVELRCRMRRPLFRLAGLRRRFGYWAPERREIVISRGLACDYPWHSVVEVLVHETAHQLASEVLAAGGEPAHGPGFRKACRLLRADPRSQGHYTPLSQHPCARPADPRDRVLVRIKKLMALAESRNPHEAEAAMVKAHSLMAKYHVDLLSRNEQRDFVSVFVGRPALRHFRDAYHLAHLLEVFYFVSGIWVPAYVLEKGKMGRVLEITGTPPHVEAAGYVHDFVTRFIDSRWSVLAPKRRPNRRHRTDFAVGVIEGFRDKLDRQRRRQLKTIAPDALATVKDHRLEAYMAYRHPRTVRFQRRAARVDLSVYEEGLQAGRELVISRGITQKTAQSVLKIAHR